eukprot:877656-Pleurochrysis_carterae.AAC.1
MGAGASRDGTRAGVILGLPHRRHRGHPGCASARTARRSGSCCARGRGRWRGKPAGEAHSSGLGAAGNAQGQARREARKARCEGHRARAH